MRSPVVALLALLLACSAGSKSGSSADPGAGAGTSSGGSGSSGGGSGSSGGTTPPAAWPQAGAALPIRYELSSLTGTVRYVAPGGSDAAAGTVAAPLATLTKAAQVSAAGDTIVVRGGTYPLDANKAVLAKPGVAVVAYPGEVPTFDGSIPAPSTSTAEGELRWFAYTRPPAGLGEGLQLANLQPATFTSSAADAAPTGIAAARGFLCVNDASTTPSYSAPTSRTRGGCAAGTPRVVSGYFPDQVWLDGRPLAQVLDPGLVVPGTFYVPRASDTDATPAAGRVYLSAADAADPSRLRLGASTGTLLQISAPDVRVEGLRIVRHSPRWNEYAVLVATGGDRVILRNLELEQNAAISVKLAGGSAAGGAQLLHGCRLEHVTVRGAGWLAAVVLYADDAVIAASRFEGTDPAGEFVGAPQRGAIKSTKVHRMTVVDSIFRGNTSVDLWWDQSSYDAVVARSWIVNPLEEAIFFEISHRLTVVDSRLESRSATRPALRAVGSSGLRLVNDTLRGGRDVIGIYTDARSKPYLQDGVRRPCSEHARRYDATVPRETFSSDCNVDYASDFDVARPGAFAPQPSENLTPGLDWMPALDLLVDDVIADPTASGFCATPTAVCVDAFIDWTTASKRIQHQVPADTILRSAPRAGNAVVTLIDGNVYQSAGRIFTVRTADADQPGAFAASDLATLAGAAGLGSAFYGFTGAGQVEQAGHAAGAGYLDADGAATSALQALHASAAPVPRDPILEAYLPAGTRHRGSITWETLPP